MAFFGQVERLGFGLGMRQQRGMRIRREHRHRETRDHSCNPHVPRHLLCLSLAARNSLSGYQFGQASLLASIVPAM